jgi:hypothetical protein
VLADIVIIAIVLVIAKIAGTESGRSKATVEKAREINEID